MALVPAAVYAVEFKSGLITTVCCLSSRCTLVLNHSSLL